MCRSIKTLYHLDPPATPSEIEAAALQFVRKVSGYRRPSQINERPFNQAVQDIAQIVHQLLDELETGGPIRQRD